MKAHGEIIHHPTGRVSVYHVRRLGAEDIEDLLHMQMIVEAQVQEKDTLQPLSKQEFNTILEGAGLLIGVFVEEELIAFRALWYPGPDPENLGMDIGLPEEEWDLVVHQEISCVRPDYRGNRLQKRMGAWIMQAFREEDTDKAHLLCTVHPRNISSLKDKLAQGMAIVRLKEKYAGMLRYILYRPVSGVWEWEDEREKVVQRADLTAQKELLAAGYYGAELMDDCLIFRRSK
ncbi:GNAT family N-acetyltransferase [Bacillus sp. SB49]|uniref:hypothetical protein n=1 Tax=Bacillus sp. SB49 TaxID=1071080 RepID=UPI00041EE7CA|nr:hypothetical protein [Bacillus sp. SB49]QHT47847.1 GNAT family N-acetyltransferase [Bacillus sp. SB49]